MSIIPTPSMQDHLSVIHTEGQEDIQSWELWVNNITEMQERGALKMQEREALEELQTFEVQEREEIAQAVQEQEKFLRMQKYDEFWSRYDPSKTLYGSDGVIIKRVFYTREAMKKNTSDWCPYCMNVKIVCNEHQVIVYNRDLKEIKRQAKNPNIQFITVW